MISPLPPWTARPGVSLPAHSQNVFNSSKVICKLMKQSLPASRMPQQQEPEKPMMVMIQIPWPRSAQSSSWPESATSPSWIGCGSIATRGTCQLTSGPRATSPLPWSGTSCTAPSPRWAAPRGTSTSGSWLAWSRGRSTREAEELWKQEERD